jgi:putative two-component system response regulator
MSDKRIFIIEDNPVNMELATDLLESAGYETMSADNAEEGVRLVRQHKPDMVLMDIALPGMDGLTATGILKGDVETAHIPIIALTAHAMKGDEEKALAVGCMGYITKPINTRTFTKTITDYINGVTSSTAVPVAPAAPSAPTTVPVTTPAATPVAPPPARVIPTTPVVTPSAPLPIPTPAVTPPTPSPWGAPVAPPTAPPATTPMFAASSTSAPVAEAKPVMPPVAVPPSAIIERPAVLETPIIAEAAPVVGAPPVVETRPVPLTITPDVVEEKRPAAPMADRPSFIAPSTPFAPARPVVPPTPTAPAPVVRADAGGDRSAPLIMLPGSNRRGRRREAIGIVAESSTARLLVVDDDELNREMITAQLRTLGYDPVVVNDGFEALATVDETFDLILLDVMMPGMDGCETCRRIREEKGLTDLPIIMVTALSSREDQLRAVESGANDWITKPVDRNELRVRTDSQLKMKAAQDALKKHQRDLESTVRARTAELRRALEQVTSEKERTHEAYMDTMQRLALAAEFRDGFMAAAHIRCIGNYCAVLARGMGLPEETAEMLLHASPIHDIGLLGIPEDIIRKGDVRNHEEETYYRDHTVLGARLLSGARSDLLRAAEVIALSHHEKWDGSGFPHGRAGEAIPLFGRICAVADTFDSITAYNGGEWRASNEDAKEVLMAGRGTDFDPQVIDAFFARWDEIEAIQRRFRRTEAPPEDLMPRKLAA